MPLPKYLTTVTTLSKTIALFFFLLFPFIGFYLGMQYQKNISPQAPDSPTILQSLFCSNWETVCDPNYTDPNGGCAPKRICLDLVSPTPIPTWSMPKSPTPTAKLTCTPRPACLDATPKCKIPETKEMCPKTSPSPSPAAAQAMCTQDAKRCSDGTYVGRTGPHCEFAACPLKH